MFGLGKIDHATSIVIDVGSGSVGVALVCEHPAGPVEKVWSHREYCLIQDDATAATQLKQIKTAFTNAFLELNQTGLQTLKATGHSQEIKEVQAIVAAPWSFTITKTISLKDDKPFTVDDTLVDELVEAAKKQSELILSTNKLTEALGLQLTHEDVLSTTINGYSITEPLDQEGKEISLSYTQTAVAKAVSATIEETIEKFFPAAEVTMYSFMYVFYLTMRNRHPNTSEVCLIDVTGEATEVGIVREDVLQHTTFSPNGIHTIARDIAKQIGAPKTEAYAYMKDDPITLLERLPKKFHPQVTTSLEQYQEQVSSMFLRTGDTLSIPETVFLHTDFLTESFFVYQLEAAAAKATGKRHIVHPVTAKALGVEHETDAGLIISINFLAQKKNYMRLLPKIK